MTSKQEERLGHCVHCGFCLPACPTYTRLGDEADSPRGRLHLMQAVIEGRLDPGADAFQTHLDRCLGCRACETVCPSGVEYGYLLERARDAATRARPPGLLVRVLLGTMAHPVLRGPLVLGGRIARATGVPEVLARRLSPRGLAGALRLAMGMLATSRPERLSHRFDEGGAEEERRATRTDPGPLRPGSAGRVALLEGCIQKGLFGQVNRATRQVLEVNGWEVVSVGGQGCCGALHAHSGALAEARRLARVNLEAFQSAQVDHVVVNAAGCGAHLGDLAELLEGESDVEDARDLCQRVVDVSVLLAGGERRPRVGAPVPLRVTWDPPCHLLHAQRIKAPPLRLMESIPGLRITQPADAGECCGGAGIYGITHPELGGEIGRDKAEAIAATSPQVVATANPGCQMQIGAALRQRSEPGDVPPVVHPVELLAESYRRAGWI